MDPSLINPGCRGRALPTLPNVNVGGLAPEFCHSVIYSRVDAFNKSGHASALIYRPGRSVPKSGPR